MTGLIVGLGIAILIALLWFSGGGALSRDLDPDSMMQLAFLGVLASFVGWGFFSGGWRNVRKDLRDLLFWFGALLLLVGAYSFKDEAKGLFARITGGLVPGVAVEQAPGEYVITRSRGGMFLVDGAVNGRNVRFIFDTGASTIALTAADARQAGITPPESDYTIDVQTANGIAKVAPAFAETLQVGGITVRNVRVTVAKPAALSRSLLGHTFLDKLKSYEVRGDRLILRG